MYTGSEVLVPLSLIKPVTGTTAQSTTILTHPVQGPVPYERQPFHTDAATVGLLNKAVKPHTIYFN